MLDFRHFGGLIRNAALPAHLSPGETRLLRLHLLSALLSGTMFGVLNLADAVLVKTLNGSPLQVTVLNVLSGVAYLAAIFWGSAMRQRRKAPFVFAAALAGRLGLGLVALSSSATWFILVYGLSSVAEGVIVTAQASIVQRAYSAAHRARLFGLAVSATTLARLLTTVGVGWILDWREPAYPLVFAVTGLGGLAGAWLMGRMERASEGQDPPAPSTPVLSPEVSPRPDLRAASAALAFSPSPQAPYRPMGEPSLASGVRSVRRSIALVAGILRQDHRYRRFQRNFFLYGVAFLSLTPVVPLFLVRDLGLDYAQIGMAKGLMGQAGMLLFPPLLGRALERLKPARFCARIFALLAFFPAGLAASLLAPPPLRIPLVFAAFGIWGLGMAGISLAWHLSSIEFSGKEDPSSYQTVHVVLTGVRGTLSPMLGYGVIRAGSNLYAFLLSMGLFVAAAALMARMGRAAHRETPPEPLRMPD